MTFWLLPNTAGEAATAVDVIAGDPTLSSGYDASDLIAGPRSTRARYDASASAGNIYYDVPTSTNFTHLVISRADWLLTQAGLRIRPVRHTGAAASVISGVDYNPLTASNLLGPTSQDLVMAFDISANSDNYGIGIAYTKTGGAVEAVQMSKMIGSVGFTFGQEPDLQPPPNWDIIAGLEMFTPMKGFEAYEVERRITLTWRGISVTKCEAFKALPRILEWPLYLYDDAGNVWDWKLEHVIVEGWSETTTASDLRDLEITFLRLRHYG